MKKIRYLGCILFPILFVSCGLFIAPRYEVIEDTLRASLDTYLDDGDIYHDLDGSLWSNDGGPKTFIMLRFPENKIPLGAQILSAKLILHTQSVITANLVGLHRIQRSWDGATTFPEVDDIGIFFEPDSFNVFVEFDDRDYIWEMRKIVQSWVSGSQNHGVLLQGFIIGNAEIYFDSNEGAMPPELHVRYY